MAFISYARANSECPELPPVRSYPILPLASGSEPRSNGVIFLWYHPEEVGSYVTSLQFLLCQQYVHRRECMGKNKDVATTKQNEGQGCFVSKQVYLR